VEVDLRVIPRGRISRSRLFGELPTYDLVYIQRRLLSPLDLFALRRASKRLVYDFDDAVMYRSSRHSNQVSLSRRWAFKRMVRTSDAVIAGNQFLKGEALRYVGEERVTVVPTAVDMERYPPKDYGEPGDSIIVGWIGSGSTLWYLRNLMPVLETLYERCPRLKLKVVSDEFFDCPTVPIVKKKWALEDEVSDLQSFDIGLMPLTEDLWSQGKCGLKAVQYSAAGIPVVCSPIGINRDIVEDGLNGYWASMDDQWVERISRLVDDPPLRVKMGMEGRKRVERSFSVEVTSKQVFDLFRKLCMEG
jgi:glycosyltransferase involved in cell wall biosynthesis